jgi:arylsulfatase A-like enzyme
VPGIGADSIAPEILDKLGNKYERVVLVLMDALALHRLQRWMVDGTAPIWDRLRAEGLFAALSSITPSTTSAALTSYWTGRSPTEHGITGYEMWMKEYGVVANTITHSPIAFQNEVGSLERAGFTPDNFMTLPTLGSHLKTHGVKTYAFQHRSIAGSGLSKMLLKGTEINAFTSAADLWVNLRELLEDKIGEKLYAWVYWGVVDHFGHIYGPDNERTSAEFTNFSDALEKQFLAHLSPAARRNTLLILTADHGQIATHPNPDYDLRNHPDLSRRLHIYPTGEHRLPYLYVRPGQTEVVREYVESAWPGQFTVLETRYVVQTGLFGPGEPHPRLLDRLGDFVLISHEDAYLWWADKKDHLLGRHGGLHPEEMLVPFLAVPL